MLLRLLTAMCFAAFPALAQPNIVLVLVDDFSMNLMPQVVDGVQTMPALAQMQAEGMTFDNYFVSDSLCCPSRASIFTGMLPHNTGVLTNEAATGGGIEAFTAHGDEAKSFAPILQAGGYKTAFMGKYLNGYHPDTTAQPPGWGRWVSTDRGYAAFGYTLNDNGVLSTPPEHFTDTIAEVGRTWITTPRAPFFIELAPFSPHGPYTPPARYTASFLGAVIPKTPAYAVRPDATAPDWLASIGVFGIVAKDKAEANYIKRVQASKGVDDLIATVRQRLANKGLTGTTYVIFTADNGYHMGDYSLRPGKKTPFDTDIRVPFVIVGPGIAPGSHNSRIVQNIDIMPTILELAGLPIPATVDGQSMFTGIPRTMAVVEHTGGISDPTDPDYTPPDAGDPPSYTALRAPSAMYVEYDTGEVGYYDLTADPYELHNAQAGLSVAERARFHDAVIAARVCAGASCAATQHR